VGVVELANQYSFSVLLEVVAVVEVALFSHHLSQSLEG
jgi:hypothetical protein